MAELYMNTEDEINSGIEPDMLIKGTRSQWKMLSCSKL